jgi:hypothetical protein
LATRVRELIGGEPELAGKKMFGGLAILLDGKMAVGVRGDGLIVRTDPGQQEALLAEPGARPFDLTGRPMRGWLMVPNLVHDADLRPVKHACANRSPRPWGG